MTKLIVLVAYLVGFMRLLPMLVLAIIFGMISYAVLSAVFKTILILTS